MKMKRHILIVDENQYVVDILVQTLSKDFRITVANTGQEAARLLIQGNRFDTVLTELDLPVFNGLELTKLIRMSHLTAQTPVVILSNVSDSTTRIDCLEQGVDAFLSKPFNPLEVKAKLHSLLRRADLTGQQAPDSQPLQIKSEAKTSWPQRSRILSMLLGDMAVS
ncbi:hypothetical protein GCM10028816_02690 [Spirosoma lituiforme]